MSYDDINRIKEKRRGCRGAWDGVVKDRTEAWSSRLVSPRD